MPDDDVDDLIDSTTFADIGDPVPVTLAATTVYVPLLVLGAALAVLWQGTVPGPFHGFNRLLEDLALGVTVGLLMVLTTWGLARLLTPLQTLELEFRKVLGPLDTRSVVALALLSGSAEELLFRGSIQPWLGFVPTSILFGCLHFVPSVVFLPWTIFALLAGFAFGGLFEWRGTLWAPLVAHMLVNGINLHLIVSGRRLRPTEGGTGPE